MTGRSTNANHFTTIERVQQGTLAHIWKATTANGHKTVLELFSFDLWMKQIVHQLGVFVRKRQIFHRFVRRIDQVGIFDQSIGQRVPIGQVNVIFDYIFNTFVELSMRPGGVYLGGEWLYFELILLWVGLGRLLFRSLLPIFDLFRRREEDYVQVGVFVFEVAFPCDHKRRRYQVDFVQYENDVFMQVIRAVFVKFRREMQRRESYVNY